MTYARSISLTETTIRIIIAFVLACTALLTFVPGAQKAFAAPTSTADLNTQTPADLANSLVGAGVTISNVTYTGPNSAAGTFTGGGTEVGFADGVILSSGNIADIAGPNNSDSMTTSFGTPGDADLAALAGQNSFDAAVLEFDFNPGASDEVFFEYVFGSDEYNEYVNAYNDVFAFYVNGVNCATIAGQPVSVNTINNNVNSLSYRNNDPSDGVPTPIDIEADGLTVVLTCAAAVNPNVTNHIKLAIADSRDSVLDSWVLLKAGSFSTIPPVGDDVKPSCKLTFFSKNQIQVTVQDTGSGIASIVVDKAINTTVTTNPNPVPVGTTAPVVVTSTKINVALASQTQITVTDVAGNSTTCDPVLTTVIRDAGKPETQTHELAATDRYATISNDTPGVKNIELIVNGTKFKATGLKDGETRVIDIAAALQEDGNTVTMVARGPKGASATVMIGDVAPE